MSYETNMTGIISKNDRKTEDRHPDIKGQCEVDGVEYWVDGWQKSRKSDGAKFYSLRFKKKDAKPQAKPEPQKQATDFDDFDDAPF